MFLLCLLGWVGTCVSNGSTPTGAGPGCQAPCNETETLCLHWPSTEQDSQFCIITASASPFSKTLHCLRRTPNVRGDFAMFGLLCCAGVHRRAFARQRLCVDFVVCLCVYARVLWNHSLTLLSLLSFPISDTHIADRLSFFIPMLGPPNVSCTRRPDASLTLLCNQEADHI